MNKVIIFLILWSSLSVAIDSPELTRLHRFTEPLVVRVYFDTADQAQELKDQLDVWSINAEQNHAVVYLSDVDDFDQIMTLGLPVHADGWHNKELKQALTKINEPTFGGGNTIPGFACYSTVEHTFQRMEQLVTNHPTLASIEDIGDTWEKLNTDNPGFDIRILKLTNQAISGDKPILFLASAIHAREYTTAELNTRFAEFLLDQYGTNPDVTWILDNHEVHFSLQTNPDGRKEAETGILWRKNKNNDHCANTNNRGVDLNRNYPFVWDELGGECTETFAGSTGGSEPEVAAQLDYLRTIFEDNRGENPNDPAPADTPGIFVDIHSFSELILWPWGFTSGNTANANQFAALGRRTAWFSDYRPQPVNQLVVTPGGSIDTTYGELGVASLAFELGTSFFQDCNSFENQILPDNLQSLLYLARVTQAPYIQPLGPDITELTTVPNVIAAGDVVQINGIADDGRYNQSNGVQTIDNVGAVALTVDELPINAASSQAMNANDGSFSDPIEAFNGSLDTSALSPGQHLVYLQATDSAGNPGGTFAQFVDVVDTNNVAQLSGQVLDASNGQPISGALLRINQSQALSDAQGQYSQWVQPATADLTVSAENYVTQVLADISLNVGQTTQQDILLSPFCLLFADDVEGGDLGWTTQNPWTISAEQSQSPNNSWHDSPGGNYANNLDISLTSPTIDISDASSLEVSYASRCDTEADFDFGIFEVQFDGGAWQEINRCDGNSNWKSVVETLNIPGNSSEFNFRFRLNTDTTLTRDGWHLDDIQVRASGNICGQFNNDLIFANGFEALTK